MVTAKNFIDLTGQKFGKLIVVERGDDYISKSGRKKFDGGVYVIVNWISLKKKEN